MLRGAAAAAPTGAAHGDVMTRKRPGLWTYTGLFALSAGTLLFEISLTRFFSVAQFYHFAFMVVSLALLGFGASGTALALWSGWRRYRIESLLGWLSLGFALSAAGSYLCSNLVPFDSFSMAWDRRQIALLALQYLLLTVPFLCSGAAVGVLLAARPASASRTYFVNLIGSATGCFLALIAPSLLGAERVIIGSCLLGAGAALVLTWTGPIQKCLVNRSTIGGQSSLAAVLLLTGALWRPPEGAMMRLSPYKDLSFALNVPGARVLSSRWNAYSRVDLIESTAIRALPGLSYRYTGSLPLQRGLTVDGGDMTGVIIDDKQPDLFGFLPGALAYILNPHAHALLLEPRAGLDILLAQAMGAGAVTAVEPNPLVISAAEAIYSQAGVETVIETGRSFAHRPGQSFDVVTVCLISPYRPVRSGAYSLAEDYRLTVEGMRDYLALLAPDGILQITRWLQTPPSEETRLFALGVTALEQQALSPASTVLFFRGYNTATLLIKPDGLSDDDLRLARDWLDQRAFDLVYGPGVSAADVNRHNVLPTPDYYLATTALVNAETRSQFYSATSFDVRPPTDDRPFFGHYFRWSQIDTVLQELGHTWQPFGGAGYFVLFAILALALLSATLIILLPLFLGRLGNRLVAPTGGLSETAVYFGLVGVGFLFYEIPLAQRFILFLGQPVYGLTAVLMALLFFSGLGSLLSARLHHRKALMLLVVLLMAYPLLLPQLYDLFLGRPLPVRLVVANASLAPLGVLLGVPLPKGIARLERTHPHLIPWAWGINGAASVVASVGAALLALTLGFSAVLLIGSLCYLGALVAISRPFGRGRVETGPPEQPPEVTT